MIIKKGLKLTDTHGEYREIEITGFNGNTYECDVTEIESINDDGAQKWRTYPYTLTPSELRILLNQKYIFREE